MKPFRKIFFRVFGYCISATIMALMAISFAFIYLESRLPDVETLKTVKLQVPLRIYSADKQLIAEFGEKRRIPITLKQVPKQLIQAILDTEDQRFYDHPGVDIVGLVRAAVELVRTGEKNQGGSTITMQVARNFFLDREKTYVRKINEILLAIQIDRTLSKDKILELYLNKIYFGNRAYGVAASAQVYYGKTLQQLTLPQIAMIAGLPKAPSSMNPLANPVAAKKRRNHVLERMYEVGDIDKDTYQLAKNAPLTAQYHNRKATLKAPFVAEMIRQILTEKYGTNVYNQGFRVYTTIDSHLQVTANHAVKTTLHAYDKRHGYRGAITNLGSPSTSHIKQWLSRLQHIANIANMPAAIVVAIDEDHISALQKTGAIIEIPQSHLTLAFKHADTTAPISNVIKLGDVIRTHQLGNGTWELTQAPEVEGALLAMSPQNGAILALVGGYDFTKSHFNRAVQAVRQPGSSFKPFIYAAALEKGFTLASIINDAPVVVDDPSLTQLWRPQNDNRRFYGPMRMRMGLVKSRNLVSIRILDAIGIPYTVQYLKRFGFDPQNLPHSLSLALGSLDITPLQLTTAYAIFANGGYQIEPYLIDHIDDINGKTILTTKPTKSALPVIDKQIVYLINSALQDVIKHGTGRHALVLKRQDIAGKTGTTNDQLDAWFAGYTPKIVVTTWVGFDKPRSLHEYASKAALPMWITFMKTALIDLPETFMPEPPGIVTVRIDPKTGLLANAGDPTAIFEIFRKNTAPKFYSAQSNDEQNTTDDTPEENHLF